MTTIFFINRQSYDKGLSRPYFTDYVSFQNSPILTTIFDQTVFDSLLNVI